MAFLAGALAAAGMMMVATQPAKLTPERVFAAPELSGPRARGVQLSPDGTLVTYVKAKPDDSRVTDLWAADVDGGAPRLVIDARSLIPKGRELSEAEKSRRERQGVQSTGVVDYAWDDEGRFILVPVEGNLWLYARATGKVTPLTHGAEDHLDAKISPKGTYVSYVRGDNLYVCRRAAARSARSRRAERSCRAGRRRSSSHRKRWPGRPATGGRRTSAASRSRTSTSAASTSSTGSTSARTARRSSVSATRARAGPTRSSPCTSRDLATHKTVAVDLGANADVYVARVDWSRDGTTLYVQRQSRDQRRLDLLAVNPATGTSHVVLSETSPHWVELSHDFRALRDGSFLWSSERSGYRHLYLYGADGTLTRAVTQGAWPVDAVQGVDEARGVVFFLANKETPIERRLYEVSYRDPAEPRALTSAGGTWAVTIARNGTAFAGTYQDPMTPPRTALYRADGSMVRWIEENALAPGHPFFPYAGTLRAPQFGTIAASDGEPLWWSMRTPPGFDPKKRYPVVVQVYGGPGAATVRKVWNNPSDQLYLDAGFILFSLDNHGTPDRSVAFKTAIDRKLGQWEVADQLAGAAVPEVLAVRRSRAHRRDGLFVRRLHDADAAHRAGLAVRRRRRRCAADGLATVRHALHGALHGHAGRKSRRLRRIGSDGEGGTPASERAAAHSRHGRRQRRLRELDAAHGRPQSKAIPFETMLYPGLRHRAGWTQNDQLHRTRTVLEFLTRTLHPVPAPLGT